MSWVNGVHRAAAAVVVCAFAGLAMGQVTYTAVIAPGQPAPGTTLFFSSPQNPTCASNGRLAVYSFLEGAGVNPGFNNAGFWAGGAGSLSLRAWLGSTIGGGGLNFSGIEPGTLTQNRAGAVVFAGFVNSSFSNDRCVFHGVGGVATIAAREGDLAPDTGGAVYSSFLTQQPNECALNDAGRLAFLAFLSGAGVTSSNNIGLFAGDAATGTYSLVARRGEPAPGTGGATINSLNGPAMNSSGTIAFYAFHTNIPPSGPTTGLYTRSPGGALQAALLQNDPAPGFPAGFRFSNIGSGATPSINDAGQILITGTAFNGASNWGAWRGTPGALLLIARDFDAAPGAPAGATFQNFSTSFLTRNGTVLLYANLFNSPMPAGMWISIPGQALRKVVLSGEQAADLPAGIVYLGFNASQTANAPGYTINNRGESLFLASLNYLVGSTPANGLFAGRAGRVRKVAASGDVLAVSPGVFRTVQTVFAFTGSSPDTGRQTSINDRGEVAFSCTLVGGGGATFIARLPHPCPGDANADDMIGFADLNAVIGAFNTVLGGPGFDANADFDQDDDVDFGDLNAVLTGFNSGC